MSSIQEQRNEATSKPTFESAGKGTDGRRYESISELWKEQLLSDVRSNSQLHDSPKEGEEETEATWYAKSESYWSTQTASVQGMLGGLDELHERDIVTSREFITKLKDSIQIGEGTRVLDVGAGIGRVTKHLLLPIFETVDMLEQNAEYLEESNNYVVGPPHPAPPPSDLASFGGGEVGKRIAVGMQDFQADGMTSKNGLSTGSVVGTYDVIWIQWTIGYLTDDDFICFLKECVKSLKNGSKALIIVKDNVAKTGFIVDKEDSSVMRSHGYMMHLFEKADMKVIKQIRQTDFPRGVHPVRMYALRSMQNLQP